MQRGMVGNSTGGECFLAVQHILVFQQGLEIEMANEALSTVMAHNKEDTGHAIVSVS